MKINFTRQLHKSYKKVTDSIAFYPAVIAIVFLGLSVVMLEFDFSETGKHFKSSVKWIRLRDTDTARTIVSTIIGGIISLTVFSFSMVMILLNQAASQMSNRTLESMISNRFHQVTLGFYIGSIVYALSLLTTIRDIDSGIYVPALSIYLLLLVTVTDIFLFIYFLHYVTQQVKFETIIKRIYEKTMTSLEKAATDHPAVPLATPALPAQMITMPETNYFQGFGKHQLAAFAKRHKLVLAFVHPAGTYLLKGQPLVAAYSKNQLSSDVREDLASMIDLYRGQPIEENHYYGFHQLAEVALKALSPGINDPETAVLSIHALTDLFAYLLGHTIETTFSDKDGTPRVQTQQWSFETLFSECFYAIWDYGDEDRYTQKALIEMMEQLQMADTQKSQSHLLVKFLQCVKEQKEKSKLF